MARKPTPKRAAAPKPAAEPHPHYSDATAAIFRAAVAALAEDLPAEQEALAKLLEQGQLHDPAAVAAVLSGGAS